MDLSTKQSPIQRTTKQTVDIYLRFTSGKAFQIKVPKKLSYEELKNVAQEKASIPSQNIILILKGTKLTESSIITLSQKNIIHVVDYANVNKKLINIAIKCKNQENRKIILQIQSNQKIKDIMNCFEKQKFQKQAEEQFQFIYAGKKLNLQKSLKQQFVQDYSEIIYVSKSKNAQSNRFFKNIEEKVKNNNIKRQIQQQKQNLSSDIIEQKINSQSFKKLILQLSQEFSEYLNSKKIVKIEKYNLSILQIYVSNILEGIIIKKLDRVNMKLMTLKDCKIEIVQEILRIQLIISKFIEENFQNEWDLKRQFFKRNDNYLSKHMGYLKTVYPRGIPLQAAQLSDKFKQFDVTDQFQYDFLINSATFFTSSDSLDITKNIKLLFNKIINELDKQYSTFSSMIQKIDKSFKIDHIKNIFKLSKKQIQEIEQKQTQQGNGNAKWKRNCNKEQKGIKQLQVKSNSLDTQIIKFNNNPFSQQKQSGSAKQIIYDNIENFQKEKKKENNFSLEKQFQKKIISIYQTNEIDFKMGRKISQNTAKYSVLDSGSVQIYSPQIARVLTKWLKDLQQMISSPQKMISQHFQPKFCKQQQYNMTYLNFFSEMNEQKKNSEKQKFRISIINRIKNRAIDNNDFISKNQYFQNFYLQLMSIFKNIQLKMEGFQRKSMEIIKFSYYIGQYISWIVEKDLIQSIKTLVQIGNKYPKTKNGFLNLMRFKVTDLMRCQVSGSKKKLSEIFEKFKELERQNKITIIKIKNRFQTQMGDAMIFFKLTQSFIICQCQLILSEQSKGQDSKKQKNIESLNHFLYELQRSQFGVLGEISMFLSSNSESVKSYNSKINISINQNQLKKIKQCLNHNDSHNIFDKQQIKNAIISSKQNKFELRQQASYEQLNEFICNNCLKYQQKYQNKIKIYQCKECYIKLCSNCYIKLCKQLCKKNHQQCEQNRCKKWRIQQFNITQDMIINYFKTYFNKLMDQNTKKNQMLRGQKIKNQWWWQTGFIDDSVRDEQESSSSDQVIQQLVYQNFIFKQLKDIQNLSIKQNQLKVNKLILCLQQLFKLVQNYHQSNKQYFILVTYKRGKIVFKSFRYKKNQNNIENCFQKLQKYQKHSTIQVGSTDWILIPKLMYQAYLHMENKQNDTIQRTNYPPLNEILFIFEEANELSINADIANTKQQDKLKLKAKHSMFSFQSNQFHIIYNLSLDSEDQNKQNNQLAMYLYQKQDFAINLQSINFPFKNIKDQSIRFIINEHKFNNKLQLVRNLNLSSCLIQNISLILQIFPNLQTLNLRSNRILVVPQIKLRFLQELLLSGNPLLKIDQFLNGQYIKLNKIDFTVQQDKSSIFKLNAQNLQNLHLKTYHFQNIHNQLYKANYFKKLTDLSLSINRLQQIRWPSNLKVLKLYGCDLNDQNVNMFFQELRSQNLKKLKQLALINCGLTKFPSIQHFQKLQVLHLGMNLIKYNSYEQMENDVLKKQYLRLCDLSLTLDFGSQKQYKSGKKKLIKQLEQKLNQLKINKKQQKGFEELNLFNYEQMQGYWIKISLQNLRIKIYDYKLQQQKVKSDENSPINSVQVSEQQFSQRIRKKNLIPIWQFIKAYQLSFGKQYQDQQSLKWQIQNQLSSFNQFLEINHHDQLVKRHDGFYRFDNHRIVIPINQFIKYQWRLLKQLLLYDCLVDDSGWRLLCSNKWNFISLQKIDLFKNQITTIQPSNELNKFQSLKLIRFYFNALTNQSQQYLIECMINNSLLSIHFQLSQQVEDKFNGILQYNTNIRIINQQKCDQYLQQKYKDIQNPFKPSRKIINSTFNIKL